MRPKGFTRSFRPAGLSQPSDSISSRINTPPGKTVLVPIAGFAPARPMRPRRRTCPPCLLPPYRHIKTVLKSEPVQVLASYKLPVVFCSRLQKQPPDAEASVPMVGIAPTPVTLFELHRHAVRCVLCAARVTARPTRSQGLLTGLIRHPKEVVRTTRISDAVAPALCQL